MLKNITKVKKIKGDTSVVIIQVRSNDLQERDVDNVMTEYEL